jgi:flagellar M-ring protein FliF
MAEEKSAKRFGLTVIKDYFARPSLSWKVFLVGVIMFILAIIWIINAAGGSGYGVLCSNLSAGDSGRIIQHLILKKVPYKLSADGSSILVPEDRIAGLKIELAAAGLPGAPISGTDFGQNIDYLRALRERMEKDLAREIISVLEPHVGSGKIKAVVKLEMDFNKEESTEETLDPDNMVKVSENTETSTGVPGGGAASPQKSRTEKNQVNYEVPKKVTRLTRAGGQIRRLSALVLVDDAVNVEVRRGRLVGESRKRTAEELEVIKKITRAAVGFDSRRGDIVEVVNLPFDTSSAAVSEYYQNQKSGDLIKTVITYAAYGLVFLVLLFLVTRLAVRKFAEIVKQAPGPGVEGEEMPRPDSEKMAALREARDRMEIEKEVLEKYRVPRDTRKVNYIRQKVKTFAEENIEETAALVRGFLIED